MSEQEIMEVPEDLDLSASNLSDQEGLEEEIEGDEKTDPDQTDRSEGELVLNMDDEDEEDDFEDKELEEGEEGVEGRKRAPGWIRDMRKSHRELLKENKKLHRKLSQRNEPQEEEEELGPEPTLEDYDHDDAAYKNALKDYWDKQKTIEARKTKKEEDQNRLQEQWKGKLENYHKQVKELNHPRFDDYADIVGNTFDERQNAIIIESGEKAAEIVAVLGQNPKKLEELAKIDDPIRFALEIGSIKATMKINNRKSKPQPERKVVGNATLSNNSYQKQYDQLLEEAAKTGEVKKLLEFEKRSRPK